MSYKDSITRKLPILKNRIFDIFLIEISFFAILVDLIISLI